MDGATGAEFRPAPLGDGSPEGKMWTSDDLITDPSVLSGLRADGVVSLDMETAAIARVCDRRGIVWSVFRSISDRATDGSVDEEVFRLSNQDGTPNAKAIASYVVRRPGRLPAMARMAKSARLATERAADAALERAGRVPGPLTFTVRPPAMAQGPGVAKASTPSRRRRLSASSRNEERNELRANWTISSLSRSSASATATRLSAT